MKPRSRFRGLALFVTVGSTRFDKLIQLILTGDCASQLVNLGFARLVMQIGKSEYNKDMVQLIEKNYELEITIYDFKASILEDIEIADVVIGHAGAGTCLEVLRANRRLLIVINDSLMDNHQSELADQLSKENYVIQTSLEEFNNNLDLICDSDTKLEKFPLDDSSKFEEIFNEALKRASRL